MKNELYKNGIISFNLPLPKECLELVKVQEWPKLDQLLFQYLKVPNGFLYSSLKPFHEFKEIEHIIAIRDAKDDEDGIWHDDGSRHMAFTWSLNEDPSLIEGGELLFRKRGQKDFLTIKPPIIGTLIVFLTGEYNFEHKVNQVLSGRRKTIAGWCS